MTKKKIVYILSLIDKSNAFEWTALALKDRYDLTFILLQSRESRMEQFLVKNKISVKTIFFKDSKNYPLAFFRIFIFLLFKRPEVVHAHLFEAQLIGLPAAFFARIKKRIYTRHNSNYHQVYHPRAVKYDKLCNRLATHIVSISQATDHALLSLERVPASKVVRIPHGFQLDYFSDVSEGLIEKVRSKWKIPAHQPVIGVVARHVVWKGIQYIIPAFEKFLQQHPSAFLILANARGPYQESIKMLISKIPQSRYVMIPFEDEVGALYKLMDVYVHVPIDPFLEAFGQTYVESLAAGVPGIFTLSGIAEDFIKHEENALVVDYQNSNQIYDALIRLWGDQELRQKFSTNGNLSVHPKFSMGLMLQRLNDLYHDN